MAKFLDVTEEEVLSWELTDQERDVLFLAHQIMIRKKLTKKPGS